MKENLISSATQAEQINQVQSVDLIALFKYLLQKNYKRPVSHILMQRKSNNWFKLNEMNNPNYCMHNWQTFVSLIYYCRLIWVKEFKRLQQN